MMGIVFFQSFREIRGLPYIELVNGFRKEDVNEIHKK